MFEYVNHTLKAEDDIRKLWSGLCENVISEEDSYPVFDDLLRQFMMVGNKQFLKDTKSNLNIF